MRYPAFGDWTGRLAKLAAVPLVGVVIAACTEQVNHNPTGDDAAPNLFGETANGIGFPHEVVTKQGIEAASLYLPVFLIAVAIFVLVEGLLLYLALRYRKRSSGDDLPKQTHGNNTLEIIWTAIPMAIVFVLFIVSTTVLTSVQSKSDEHGAVVDVQAFRFGWIFEYQDPGSADPETGGYDALTMNPITGGGREGAPTMVLPVGEPVLIRLTAADVIHSFYVPSFFFKRDAIPGRINEFEITIEKPGVYGGQCAEFCGLAHGDMYFSVDARDPADYDAWLAEQTSGSATGNGPADAGPEGQSPAPDVAVESLAPDVAVESPVPDVAVESPASEDATAPSGDILELAVTAEKAISYTKSELEAPAGQTVTLVFRNDSNVPHNVTIFDSSDATGERIASTEIITGPGASTEVTFTTPTEPGSYFFRCDVHPLQMTGTLVVTG